MYQVLIEKFADVLFPLLCGVAVWFGVHYFVLTPRIMKVEMPIAYEATFSKSLKLPMQVHDCLRDNYAGAMMKVGRFEASLFTASLKHMVEPFNKKTVEALEILDAPCGKTKALEAEKERLRQAAERKARADKARAIAAKERHLQELENIRQKALDEAQERKMKMYGAIFNMIFGGR